MSLTPLQHPYCKRYGRIAQPMSGNVGGRNAGAGNKAVIIITLITNELLKSFGQLGNEATTGISIQSLLNLSKLCTKLGFGLFNALKKVLNFLGQGSDGSVITPTAILPRNPQDPVYGFLQVGRAVKREVDRGE
ncbi:ROK family protein [Babesia caballi]|uniref:ROK family protein n=1 Tax=Babesia caballi TaxID=5871 RepID=A0AAV4M0A2_BABCB|nr:ROK family protein [Babesia caballi]